MRVDLNLYTRNKANRTHFTHKIPPIIVNDSNKVLTDNEYPLYVLKIINGIKNSKGFKMFFDKFDVQKITLEDFNSEALSEYYTSVRIHQPRLKNADNTGKKSIYKRIVDCLISDKNINFGENDSFSLIFRRYNDNLETKVRKTSYYKLKKALKARQKNIDKDNNNETLKNKLHEELKSEHII